MSDELQQWTHFLPLAEFWYNSSHHSAIGMSPFEALYGILPPSIASHVPGATKIASLQELLAQKKRDLAVTEN